LVLIYQNAELLDAYLFILAAIYLERVLSPQTSEARFLLQTKLHYLSIL